MKMLGPPLWKFYYKEMLGGVAADEDPFPPNNVDPHPMPTNIQEFHENQFGADDQDMNVDHQEDMEEEDGHWAFQPQVQNNMALDNLLQAVEQEELAWADGEEMPPPLEGQSSITTIVSLSDGAFSTNIGMGPNEEVNQAAPHLQNMENGLQILMQDYQDDDQEIQAPQAPAEVEVGLAVASPGPSVAVVPEIAATLNVATADTIVVEPEAAANMTAELVCKEPVTLSTEPMSNHDMRANLEQENEPPLEFNTALPIPADLDNETTKGVEHNSFMTFRPKLDQSGGSSGKIEQNAVSKGSWIDLLEDHFNNPNFKPSLLGIKKYT